MAVETRTFKITSKPDIDIIDVTKEVETIIRKSGINSGIVTVFVPGSTASVTTTEYEPNLNKDLMDAVERLVPSDIYYKHKETWNDDNGKSHIRASLFKPELTVPFREKKLLLGTWQQIVIIDFDVPARTREVICQILGD